MQVVARTWAFPSTIRNVVSSYGSRQAQVDAIYLVFLVLVVSWLLATSSGEGALICTHVDVILLLLATPSRIRYRSMTCQAK